jgi:hypothetical protein
VIQQYGSGVRNRGSSMVWYARGSGGRFCDLPPYYLDMLAEAVRHVYPKELTRAVRELLVSGRFMRSNHPRLKHTTLEQLRNTAYVTDRAAYVVRRSKMIQIMSTRPRNM